MHYTERAEIKKITIVEAMVKATTSTLSPSVLMKSLRRRGERGFQLLKMATAASLDFATRTGASVSVVHWPSNLERKSLIALSSEFHIYHSTPVCKTISPFNEPVSKLFGELWRRGEKRKKSLHLRLWNLNICIENVEAECWLAKMTLVMTSLPLARVF